MEIHEITSYIKKYIKETAKERLKLTKKDLHNLKTIEKFAIGCYLSQASSKILEISNGFIFELFFQRSLLKEVNIQSYDAFNRRVELRSSIIDASRYIFKYYGGAYSKDDMAIFGDNIKPISSNKAQLDHLAKKLINT